MLYLTASPITYGPFLCPCFMLSPFLWIPLATSFVDIHVIVLWDRVRCWRRGSGDDPLVLLGFWARFLLIDFVLEEGPNNLGVLELSFGSTTPGEVGSFVLSPRSPLFTWKLLLREMLSSLSHCSFYNTSTFFQLLERRGLLFSDCCCSRASLELRFVACASQGKLWVVQRNQVNVWIDWREYVGLSIWLVVCLISPTFLCITATPFSYIDKYVSNDTLFLLSWPPYTILIFLTTIPYSYFPDHHD